MALRWIRSTEEVIANPRRSAQRPARRCMFSSGSGQNFAMLGTVCGQVEEAVVGLSKFGARLGACGVLRIRFSVSQSRLE